MGLTRNSMTAGPVEVPTLRAPGPDTAIDRGGRPKGAGWWPPSGIVTGWLEGDRSTEQIKAKQTLAFPGDEVVRVSYEVIFRRLYVQPLIGERNELTAHVQSRASARKNADATRRGAPAYPGPTARPSPGTADLPGDER
jgi:hypothetical protein